MRVLSLLLVITACEGGVLQIGDEPEDTNPSDTTDTTDTVEDTEPTDTEPADTDPDDTEPDTETEDTEPVEPLGDLTAAGPEAVRSSSGSYDASNGCTLRYTKFEPRNTAAYEAVVILSHGFERGPEQMRGWARHLASWGYAVYTPTLCHTSFLDADHAANGRELARFANQELRVPVIYAGHSAGGLASVLAAREDTDALGVLGLDLTDSDNLGRNAAASLNMPVYGLVGDRGFCNSNNNGLAVYERAPAGVVWRIADATHCDFESPTDSGCTNTCGIQFPGPDFTDVQQQTAIAGLLAGFVLGVSGEDARGFDYWTAGRPEHTRLASGGVLIAP